MSNFLQTYYEHVAERAAIGIVPKALDAQQTVQLIELLQSPIAGKEAELLELFETRIPAGVDDAAKVKAEFLTNVANGNITSPLISPEHAVKLLGTMSGGYNVAPLIDLLDNAKLAPLAVQALSHTLLILIVSKISLLKHNKVMLTLNKLSNLGQTPNGLLLVRHLQKNHTDGI
ncbi:bifunctional aconitate hydratase 2/2-methylisocitrate dehydratase [Actinobacillus equuli]|nr:bifunctional aconitate hydratase 2/2-methylisocitrate dehydratase [Actinobacillus equuli]